MTHCQCCIVRVPTDERTIEQVISSFTLASLKLDATRREAIEFFQSRTTQVMIMDFATRRIKPAIDPDQIEISAKLRTAFREWALAFSELSERLGFGAEAISAMRYMFLAETQEPKP